MSWRLHSPFCSIAERGDLQHVVGRGKVGLPERALYTASKGAVLALTRAMAADHVRDGIRVNAVNPVAPRRPGSGGSYPAR